MAQRCQRVAFIVIFRESERERIERAKLLLDWEMSDCSRRKGNKDTLGAEKRITWKK